MDITFLLARVGLSVVDGGVWKPSCAVTAIFEESAVSEDQKQSLKSHADFF